MGKTQAGGYTPKRRVASSTSSTTNRPVRPRIDDGCRWRDALIVCLSTRVDARGYARDDAACVDVDVRVDVRVDDARCSCRAKDARGDDDDDDDDDDEDEDARVVPNGSREDATVGDSRGTSGDRGAGVDGERRRGRMEEEESRDERRRSERSRERGSRRERVERERDDDDDDDEDECGQEKTGNPGVFFRVRGRRLA